MRKPTKRWQVDTWIHRKSGARLAVYYDNKHKDFWSCVADETVKDATQEGARKKAAELADRLLVDESRWSRVLFIWMNGRNNQTSYGYLPAADTLDSTHIGFTAQRSWMMVDDEGNKLTRRWDRDEPCGFGGDIRSLSVYSWDDNHHELPYTDELWQAVRELSNLLAAAETKMEALILSSTFVPRMLGREVQLLEGPRQIRKVRRMKKGTKR